MKKLKIGGPRQLARPDQPPMCRVGIYSHFWLLLHEYTLLYMYTYMYIDIQRIQYTDSMAPSFVKFCQVYHAFARAHTTVYLGPILLLHEYTLHSYTTKYTLHYVYCSPGLYTRARSYGGQHYAASQPRARAAAGLRTATLRCAIMMRGALAA